MVIRSIIISALALTLCAQLYFLSFTMCHPYKLVGVCEYIGKDGHPIPSVLKTAADDQGEK